MTTAATLHETDADFRALIQCWIDNRRCPLPMADYLRERDLEGQAEAAEWAFWEEKTHDDAGFVRPRHSMHFEEFWWCPEESDGYKPENGVPEVLFPDSNLWIYHKTAYSPILWLLDRWAEVKAAGVELPKWKPEWSLTEENK